MAVQEGVTKGDPRFVTFEELASYFQRRSFAAPLEKADRQRQHDSSLMAIMSYAGAKDKGYQG